MKKLIIYSLIILMCLFSSQTINAATINVYPGNGTIQEAINSAINGDTIVVHDNNGSAYTYTEDAIIIEKQINLTTSGDVTVKPLNYNNFIFRVDFPAAGTTIQNFNLVSSDTPIVINANNTNVVNNVINTDQVGIQYVGYIKDSIIKNNNITGVITIEGSNGISFGQGFGDYAVNSTVTGNHIRNVLNGIIFNYGNTNNTIINNNVSSYGSTTNSVGIYGTDHTQNMQVIGNEVSACRDGIAIEKLGANESNNCTFSRNTVNNNLNGFWVAVSNSTFSNNTATNSSVSGFDITGAFNNILNNTATLNQDGITLNFYTNSDYNLVRGNNLTSNEAGIMSESTFVKFIYNHIYNNYNTQNKVGYGIISTGMNVSIINNTIQNGSTVPSSWTNYRGYFVNESSNNIIVNNNN